MIKTIGIVLTIAIFVLSLIANLPKEEDKKK